MKAAFLAWLIEIALWLDQGFNVVLFFGKADETLSARAGRNKLAGKWLGKIVAPPIDLLFRWQKPDPAYSLDGVPVASHCIRAHLKEKARHYLPQAYQGGA